jgi:type IV secretory pathway component VirB8
MNYSFSFFDGDSVDARNWFQAHFFHGFFEFLLSSVTALLWVFVIMIMIAVLAMHVLVIMLVRRAVFFFLLCLCLWFLVYFGH